MESQDTEGQETWNIFSESTRLSLPDFLGKARAHLANITKELPTLLRTDEVLRKWDSIWPDQCDYIAFSLHCIRQPAHDFAVFLRQTSHLPISVISVNYQIVAELDYFEVKIQELLAFLTTFRSIGQMQSRLLSRHRLEVLQRIEDIIRGGEEMSHQIDTWLDSLRFQE